jgi:D-glycero-D-manno-heptose 1,7-bisphosphate phosphatase
VGNLREEIHSALPESFKKVSNKRVGVFLDRDGTLNEEVNFVTRPEELRLFPETGPAVRTLNERQLVVCVISNQSGVARGLLTEDALVPIHRKLEAELHRHGAKVDRIYYCPHHPTAGIAPYNIDCACRKPKPGMLKWGEEEFGLDLARSFVVGDSVVDIQAGNAVGARTVLVRTGYGEASMEQCKMHNVPVGYVANSITEAVDHIMRTLDGEHVHG